MEVSAPTAPLPSLGLHRVPDTALRNRAPHTQRAPPHGLPPPAHGIPLARRLLCSWHLTHFRPMRCWVGVRGCCKRVWDGRPYLILKVYWKPALPLSGQFDSGI